MFDKLWNDYKINNKGIYLKWKFISISRLLPRMSFMNNVILKLRRENNDITMNGFEELSDSYTY